MTNRKTTPPPFLAANATLPTDEVTQTYARDAARQALADAALAQRDEVELEVDSMFPDAYVCAEAIVTESESPRQNRLTRALARVLGRRGGK